VSLDGQGQYGTFSINDQGAWTYTLSGPITDGEGVESDSVTYTVTDSDGSTGQGTLSVSIVDDIPSNIEPDGTFILNVVDETALNALDIDGDIDNNYGADQGGTVKFNIANATDSGMTSALAPIYFYLSSDGMTLIGSTYFDITNDPQPLADDADVLADKVFTVELSPSGNPDDYSFTLHKAVDGGVSGFNTELGSWDFQGGNTDFAFYTDLSGSDLPSVLLTPTGISGERINGTASEAGVTGQGSGGGGQNIGLNEGIRVDYVENVGGTPTQTAYDEGSPAHTFDDHVVVNGAEATFAISSGTSTVMIEAFDDLDGNDVGDGTSDDITKITINGTAFTVDDNTTLPGYVITFIGNTVQISGIQDDDSVVVFTDDGFTSLEYHYVDSDPDDSTFALGGFGASTLDPGEQVVFDLALELTDADGDTASGSINVVLAPEATTDLGTIGDDILVGSGLDDVIYAGLGDDSLTGGAGNDILSGGEGEDLFIWNTADLGDAVTPAEDVIKDFSVAENDVIDLSNVLGDGTSYDIDAVEVDGVMQLQISNNSAEIVQTINVESISVIDDSDAQTQLANLLASNNIDDGMI
jgi:VCBS repeat-containing protein